MIESRVLIKYKIEQSPAILYIKNYNPSYIEESTYEEHYIYYEADYAL